MAVGAAADTETASQADAVEEVMEPIHGFEIKDGVYPLTVDSSSSMFQIKACELTVKDGKMHEVMTMGDGGRLEIPAAAFFAKEQRKGTGIEAAAPDENPICFDKSHALFLTLHKV